MNALSIALSMVYVLIGITSSYCIFLGILAIPVFQNQVVYLNAFSMTWFKNLSVPETWGFLHNQVTSFTLDTSDGEMLHVWHILPLNVYRKHEEDLIAESTELALPITSRLAFQLLRDDPDARLVLYFHGAGGTLGSGYRPASYQAISASAPDKIHIVAIDYRGFGMSTGSPSEKGLQTDAIALAEWALNVAGISPDRIAVFGQSLGTAVSISLAHQLAVRSIPVLFSGMVLIAPFSDVEQLATTYRVAGVVPILSPLGLFPRLLAFLNTFIKSKWPSKDKLAEFVQHCENLGLESSGGLRYQISILHAEDDYDIPWEHSETIFWHAVNASVSLGITLEELKIDKVCTRTELGAGGWTVTHQTERGFIRQTILKYGLHDRIMSYPAISIEIAKRFGWSERKRFTLTEVLKKLPTSRRHR